MEDGFKYMCCVRCVTYNHSSYIKDTLHGFSTQETSFPIVYVIIDDASTDGEQMVLHHWATYNLETSGSDSMWRRMPYGQLAEAHLKGKPLLTFVILLLSENHFQTGKSVKRFEYITPWSDNSKYTALCEGDDYWIDPKKLDKQISILEKNPSVTLVYSSFRTVDSDGLTIYRPEFEYFKSISASGEIVHLLLRSNFILTLTVCFRRQVTDTDLFKKCPSRMDLSTFLAAAMYGDVCYIPEEMGCYRKVSNSLVNSHGEMISYRSRVIRCYYSERYIQKKYKKVSLRQNSAILYTISNSTINDRNWKILKYSFKTPYFLLVFSVVFILRLLQKAYHYLFDQAKNRNSK